MTRDHSLCVEASSSPISCTCAESVSTASMVSQWHALFVSLKGCNRFLPIRIASSNESRIFLYWLKISFQIQLSCIHNKMLNLAKRHNEASNKSRTCTPLRGVRHGLESRTLSVESQLESRISFRILNLSQNPRIFDRIFGIPKISESQIESLNLLSWVESCIIFLLRYPTRDLYKQLGL